LVRRIFPGSVVAIRKDRVVARGSLKRPPDHLTWPEWIAASDKGAGLERASVKASAKPVHSGRKVGVDPMEGALVRVMSSS
jgi:hypothetical protein